MPPNLITYDDLNADIRQFVGVISWFTYSNHFFYIVLVQLLQSDSKRLYTRV